MSAYVQAVDGFGVSKPEALAFSNSRGEYMSYGKLKRVSDALAVRLLEADPEKRPVVVYGHKSPLMIASFMACAKSGRAYVPIDIVYPELRVLDILDQLEAPIVLNTTDADLSAFAEHMSGCWEAADLEAAESESTSGEPAEGEPAEGDAQQPDPAHVVSGDDVFYILFTSGSTGRPKGVEVTAECVDNFWTWMLDEFGLPQEKRSSALAQRVFFDRAPFSFDLSVTDIILGLGAGDTMFALVEEDEADLGRTFRALGASNATFWVSTASFADMCLRDPAFSPKLLPNIKTFFFVGETLKNETAGKLLNRFPGCEVINGYGPTESTDLVTSTSITWAMVESDEPLPVGVARPGTELYILDPETLEPLPTGQQGELFIVGDTVAKGYFRRPELTEAAFHSCPDEIAQGRRSYRTGDAAFLDEEGMLHFRGRLDFQVKLHGFRIELGEIETALCKIDGIFDACVLPIERRGTISHLAACVAVSDQDGAVQDSAEASDSEDSSEPQVITSFDRSQAVKDELRKMLPEYMVPRKIVALNQLPLNINGKVDRKRLRELV